MHWLRAAGLAGSLLVFSWPTIAPAGSRFALSFPVVTLVFIGALLALTLGWTHTPGPDAVTGRGTSTGFAWLVGGTASALFALGLGTMLQTVLNTPITPLRADMLPVIEMAIRRLATGHDPYGMYEMPWLVPLPYGPVMWVPFTIPVALGIDMRAVTLVGVLFVPAWCAIAATVDASRRRWSSAIGWLIVLAAIVLNPDLRRFSTIGHSPAYWPLILPFAALVRRERWLGAAALLALLLVGRSTTIAIVPVFFMTVWIRAPQALTRALLVWAAVVAVLIVPFFLWDPPAMWYGMVASYPRIMKQSVWVHFPQWVTDTIGLTGWLLARHRAVLVEASQMIAMAAVWAASWGAIRRGRAPLPWMACSLAVFCMTSLWPVYYIYFDALLLFVCAALVETPVPGVPLLSTPRRAATINSAKSLGFDREIGSIEPGKLADLVVLDRKPLENLRHTESIFRVMLNGRLYDTSLNEVGAAQPRPRLWFEGR